MIIFFFRWQKTFVGEESEQQGNKLKAIDNNLNNIVK